jgi:hypothetical protein
MGTLFKYQCPNCTYVAEVSGRGDRGFVARTITISCSVCQTLYDVVVAKGEPADRMNVKSWKNVEPHCPHSE